YISDNDIFIGVYNKESSSDKEEDNLQEINNDEEYIVLNTVNANNTKWISVYYSFKCFIILKSVIIMLKETLLQDINTRFKQEEELLEDLISTIYK
ncbi:7509_t:CDS:2, partial [Racocetra fulgida]